MPGSIAASTVTVFDWPFAASTLAALVLLAGFWLFGILLIPRKATPPCPLLRLSMTLTSGLLFFNGTAATVMLGRIGFFSWVPLFQLGLAVWLWRRPGRGPESAQSQPRFALAVLGAAALCVAFVHGWSAFRTSGGTVRDFHSDLGYFAQLALGVREAGHASLWAGTLGAALVETTGPLDVWYHWGPVWFAAAVHALTGMPVLNALLHTGDILFTLLLTLSAGAVVRSLVPWRTGWCLVTGAASLSAVPLLKLFGALWLTPMLPYGVLQHHRTSLMMQMAYKADALPLLVALAAWLRGSNGLAAAMLMVAAIGAPHAVAAGGVMAGVLLMAGWLMKSPAMSRTALAIILILLSSWGLLAVGFGVGLPKTADSPALAINLDAIRHAVRASVIDIPVGLALASLLLPGLVHLMRRPRTGLDSRPHILGWMALSALAGGYAGFHLFRTLGDRFHFTMFTHVVLVIPVGIWGLASLASRSTRWLKASILLLIILCALMGASDLWIAHARTDRAPWSAADVRQIKAQLGDEPFGYFAQSDRNWWIPKHATLASMLNVRCVRLNAIESTDKAGINTAFYGSTKPIELVPRQSAETEAQWSLRFARKLGISRILEIGGETVPEPIRSHLIPLMAAGPLRLYALPAE